MINFAYQYMLWLLLIIPVLAALFYYGRYLRRKQIASLGKPEIIFKLIPTLSHIRSPFKFWLTIIALTLLILASARPQMGAKVEKAKRKGVELMLCLDISNSMLANDIKPTRLERSKQAIIQLIKKLDNDKIGIVVFAGKSFIQLPLTDDYGAALMYVDRINTDLIENQGTAIGSAITLAAESFTQTKNKPRNRAIIVISDGENHEDDALEAAGNAISKSVKVHTIGIGTPEGAPIPEIKGNQVDYKRDGNGEVVMTKLNEQMLRDISDKGKGIYIRANNSDFGLDKIFDEIAKMEKEDFEAINYSDYEDQFIAFIALAFLILLFEQILNYRKSYFSKKIQTFTQRKKQ
ncbi:MAG: VWA domain-containing protein [Bacteroidota bacterium]|jgi:Ca-activated chloride channel family protein